MHTTILNHASTIQPGTRRIKADNATWKLISDIWADKTPLNEPPIDRDSLTKLKAGCGPNSFIIHYDETRIFVTFWIDAVEHWYEYTRETNFLQDLAGEKARPV